MELELKKAAFDCYEAAADLILTQEESTETIVPDYCPDIARIIHTTGRICLHNKDLRDGKAEAGGTIKISVLYTPDGECGMRTLEFALPFSVQGEGKGSFLRVDSELEGIETRLVNPRKIATRCRILTRMSCYQKTQVNYCSDVAAEPALGVEKQQELQRATAITHILEKDFTFADELTISPGKDGAEELLLSRVRSAVTETKLVGSKMILKGVFSVELLCRSNKGQYYVTGGELPFSQILETENSPENAQCQTELQLTGADFQISEGSDGHSVTVTLYLRVCAFLRESREMQLLTDLYSTVYEANYDAAPVNYTDFSDSLTRRQSVRELLEIGVVAKSALMTNVTCGPVSILREKKIVTLRTAATIQAMYLDEGDTPLLCERRTEISTQLELPEDCQLTARATCAEEIQCSITTAGIEVRFGVDFVMEATTRKKKICVHGAKVNCEKAKDFTGHPSVVLRHLESSESLWELAKRYSTTAVSILAANELDEEGAIRADQLLLIPRRRS